MKPTANCANGTIYAKRRGIAVINLEEARKVGDKATEGPWDTFLGSGNCVCTALGYENPDNGKVTFVCDCLPDYALDTAEKDHRDNMQFIAYARNNWDIMLDEIEQSRAALRQCLDVLVAVEWIYGECDPICTIYRPKHIAAIAAAKQVLGVPE